jgi:hypothetical protein
MNKHYTATLALLTGLLSTAAIAAPGEYWEVTSKMEMPGMPFSMPATTSKVCIAKGGEADPKKSSADKNCQMSDIKTVGKKTTYKVRCDRDGEVMTGIGEHTASAGSYESKMQLSGKSQGRDMNMTTLFSGKYLGGSCDTEEAGKKMKAQICDSSRFNSTAEWIGNADFYLRKESPCIEQRKQLCERVLKDAPKDARTYSALVSHDQQAGAEISIARECKLDMAATTKAMCKTFNEKNFNELAAYCPAEAKAFREAQRRKDCEGRSYTAETRAADLKKCLSGKGDSGSDEEAYSPKSKPNKTKSDESAEKSDSGSSTSTNVLEGAKKLKGLLGF